MRLRRPRARVWRRRHVTVAMLLAYRMRSRVSVNWQGLIISRLLLVILLWRGLLRGRSPRLARFLQIQGQYDVLPPSMADPSAWENRRNVRGLARQICTRRVVSTGIVTLTWAHRRTTVGWRGGMRGNSPGESILIEGTVVSHSDLCDPRVSLSWRRVGSVGEPFKKGGEQVGRRV